MKSFLAIATAVGALALSNSSIANPETLLKEEKCARCHTAKTTKKGPSFADVAAKYKGDAAVSAKFFDMLKNGNDDHKPVKGSGKLTLFSVTYEGDKPVEQEVQSWDVATIISSMPSTT